MRKPRDYDAELTLLDTKSRELQHRKRTALGELVIATGADALPIEELAGALLMVAATTDAAQREGWRTRGAAFFCSRRGARSTGDMRGSDRHRAAPLGGATISADAGAQPR